MEIQELETFVNVVQQGSFSRAAAASGYSQAAVTIHIKNLENELHVRLFDRLGRKTSLTSSGKLFYQHAVRILNTMTEAKEALDTAGELCGSLSIGTIDSLCSALLSDIICQYHHSHPQVKIQIVTDTINELEEKLVNNSIDLLFLADQTRNDSHLIKVLDKKESVLFAVSASHPLAGQQLTDISPLLSCPFILTEKDASYRQVLDMALFQQGIELHPFLECTNTDLILSMVRRNEGITFLPEYVIKKDLIGRKILPVFVKDFQQYIRIQVFYHKNKWVSREMHTFIELIQKVL